MVALSLMSLMNHGDAEGLRIFFLEHRLAHAAIAAAVAAQHDMTLPEFDVGDESARRQWEAVMRPDAPEGLRTPVLDDWLNLHQQLHQAEYQAVGLGPVPDLGVVDFSDAKAFAQWMLEHQQIHDLVGNELGIS